MCRLCWRFVIAFICRSATLRSSNCSFIARPTTARKCAICVSAALRSGEHCLLDAATLLRCRCPRWRRWAVLPYRLTARKCPPPWLRCGCSAPGSRRQSWGRAWCRSSLMRRAPSVWPACSVRSASTHLWASAMSLRTPARCCRTRKPVMANCLKRALPKPGRFPPGSRRQPPTRYTASRCCRCTSITRCLAFSASAT
ncbi:hypothetical protein D3C79_699640 [compost metagenome]